METQTTQAPGALDATRKQIRGSSLFLLGRFLSLGINFAAQVLMVRYLSTSDYGALAYALAIVAFLQPLATLGLQEALSRFVPLYQEDCEYGKVLGTILLALGAVLASGTLLIALFWESPAFLAHLMTHDKLPLLLLSILIVLVPIEATDDLLNGLFASFASTRDIFFRKYLLGPGLKLGAVLLLIARHSTVTFLAEGYLAASLLGVLIYSGMLVRLLREQQLWPYLRLESLRLPVREVLAFVLPGLGAILATSGTHSVSIFLLGYLRSMSEVAYYRAALPVAQLNNVVMASFTLLYTPFATRLLTKSYSQGMNRLYWQTAAWMTVVSFPVFAMTFAFAQPLIVFLYGPRYQPSGPILALLALGSYFNVALGFNLQTLKVLKRLHYITLTSVLAILANVAVNLILIPRYGAFGAVLGTAGTLIGFNLLMQAGLLRTASVQAFDRRYLSVYLMTALSATGLFAIQTLSPLSFYLALPLAACASLLVLAATKKKLGIGETFPELVRMPLMRAIFA
jgi:O-antigen/teichoic acid export membrane protein